MQGVVAVVGVSAGNLSQLALLNGQVVRLVALHDPIPAQCILPYLSICGRQSTCFATSLSVRGQHGCQLAGDACQSNETLRFASQSHLRSSSFAHLSLFTLFLFLILLPTYPPFLFLFYRITDFSLIHTTLAQIGLVPSSANS